ncbi:hypothetical protein VSX64_17800 [Aurantimonas sp. C2-6-R+9]|uniref:hypothetical protein n=1 Tax=unclassified Aurantimonas TaxID=2638230 RepID=UPI002E189DA5|nr:MULTISPECIES: hypothetical protein [unclassified Aurantimonas]MEC5292480.1 hypothetical protein [Aurantimonas sp. C2-3-R2]MEC5382695.1 hypothetical protein [Aurantimonas sp. C2-6-R+9]MEC5413512.1 hypothetical protein [Aurantimonas sp. C2-4-R8]
MSNMTNPSDALAGFQSAYIDDAISIQRAERYPGVFVHVDQPNGTTRYTYAEIQADVVNAVALLILTEPVEGVPCFQLGYAVREDCRQEGKAHAIVAAAIDEIVVGLSRNGITNLYVEAVVGRDNVHSHRVAEQALGQKKTDCTDHDTGEPASQYLRRFTPGSLGR